MSSEIAYHLRMKANANKEFKATRVDVFGTPTLFSSQLTGGHSRKFISVYNNTHADSGEVLWGNSDCNVNGMLVPKGSIVDIPVAGALAEDGVTGGVDIYFCNSVSGEVSDLRVFEGA